MIHSVMGHKCDIYHKVRYFTVCLLYKVGVFHSARGAAVFVTLWHVTVTSDRESSDSELTQQH